MSNVKFSSVAHQDFFLEMMRKCKTNDSYHRAFFYVMGISGDTRRNINQLFNFKEDSIIPDGMYGGWQTSGSIRVCQLAFNLWNGYAEKDSKDSYTPYDLFCCDYAPYFMEGIKIKYPEYLAKSLNPRQHSESAR